MWMWNRCNSLRNPETRPCFEKVTFFMRGDVGAKYISAYRGLCMQQTPRYSGCVADVQRLVFQGISSINPHFLSVSVDVTNSAFI
jgi:hypothetical protein